MMPFIESGTPVTRDKIKQTILDSINRLGSVTYPDIERIFQCNGYLFKGKVESVSDACEKVVFWSGWSKDAFFIVSELIEEKLIHREPCGRLDYMLSGGALRYPIAKKATYQRRHWLPCVLKPGPEQ